MAKVDRELPETVSIHRRQLIGAAATQPLLDTIGSRRYRRRLMLTWFRTRASRVARLLVLSLAALALPHADSNHDADSAFALLVVHDASGHGVGTPASKDAEPGHCAICHLSRPFRPLPQTAIPAITSAASTGFFPVDDSTTAKADAAAQPPLRAPPVSHS